MRRVVGVLLVVTGCSAQSPPSSNAPAPAQHAATPGAVEITPAEPALPPEPTGLVTLTPPPRAVCELDGPLSDGGVDLAAVAGGPLFASVASGKAALSLGDDGSAFAEVRLPTSTVLRGFASRRVVVDLGMGKALALVYARRSVAFGGVYYPGVLALRVEGVKGGKIVVAPHGSIYPDQFWLLASARTMELSCADISLSQDPEGELRKQAPAAFLASGKEQFMWLTGDKLVAVSAAADGPASGAFVVKPKHPIEVAVLERRGQRARVRHLRIAGWVDAAVLSAKGQRRAVGDEFGRISLSNTSAGAGPSSNAPSTKPERVQRVACNTDVRLLAELESSRFVVGSIPRGQAFVISESAKDLAYLATDGSMVSVGSFARLAVPMRDAAGCAHAPDDAADAFPKWNTELRIKALDGLIDSDALSDLLDSASREPQH